MKINKKIAVSESGFVFDPTTGDSYSLNPIAAEILEMVKKEMNDDEIKSTLQEKYDVISSVLEKSLDEFYSSLRNLNLLSDD